MKRILLINHYAGAPELGMEYRPYYLAREWVERGYEVYILAANHSHVRSVQPEVARSFEIQTINGIHYIWVKTPAYAGNTLKRVLNMLSFVGKLCWKARALVKRLKPDIIIASSTYPFDAYAAARMARLAGCPLIFEVHDLWPLSPVELGGFSRKHPFIMLAQHAEDFAYRKANAVVSMLPATLPYMQSRGLPAEKWFHIPNGITIDEWEQIVPLAEPVAAPMREISRKFATKVGYVGAHGVANALPAFIIAAAKEGMEDVAFVLVGKGQEKTALQRLASEKDLTNVFFLDSIPKSQIPALLQNFDILYIGLQDQPLFRFGVSPNKLFDYMMAGKPVIQAIRAGNDIVATAGCGLSIPPEDPDAIAAAITQLKRMDADSRRRMGEKGTSYVAQNHDYKILADRFLEVMNSTIVGS